jgi:processive 1,2-diacylglycerol beta-glucosyltransferase
LIPEILEDCGIEIPSFSYASDVFFSPTSGLTNKLRKFYISTPEGRQDVLAKGLVPEKIEVNSFPLQTGCLLASRLSKPQAREKLSLQNKFTVLINLGGEGIGTTRLIKKLDRLKLDMQIVVLGGLDEKSRKDFENVAAQLSSVKLTIAGFVSNVYDYVLASDVVAGKAGINTMVEATYFKRPFLITGLYYTVFAAAAFYEKHQIGWLALETDRQVDILVRCIREPDLLPQMEVNFSKVPITFGASSIADSLIAELRSTPGLLI